MWCYFGYVLLGLAAGFASALLGIGGGVIMVPVLVLLFALPAKAATVTSLAYIAPVALYGALKQWHMGQDIKWFLVLLAVPAGLIGAELGSRAKQYVSNAHLRLIFAALMIVVGVRLGYQGWRGLVSSRPLDAERAVAESQAGPPNGPSQ